MHQLLATLCVTGYILFFSPVLPWAGMLLALAPVWWLLRRGAGWVGFAPLRLAAGALPPPTAFWPS